MSSSIQISAIVTYLLLMVALGIYFSKREVKTSEDFMVAGRRLPRLVLIGTLLATWVGSGTVVGSASFMYQHGPLASILSGLSGPIGIIILYFIADKARMLKKYTIPEMLEIRYGSLVRLIAAIFIILAYIGITSYQFIGGGYILSITTGLPIEIGTIITAVLVIFLATSGGLFSVAYTDFVSSLLIVFGFLLGLPFVLSAVGGFDGLASDLPDHALTWTGGLTAPQLLGYFLPPLLLILGDQNMYQRFSAAKDADTAKKSTIGFFIGDVGIKILTIIFATAAIVLYPNIMSDTSILQVAVSGVPISIGAIILSATVGFVITTGNSYLLSSAGNLVFDLYSRYSRKEVPERRLLTFSRLAVIAFGTFAYVLGAFFPSVLAIQMYSYTMYGAAITPSILASFLWKRATGAGALASIIMGGTATMFWELVLGKPLGWNSVLFSLPLSIIALIVVSLLTKNKKINIQYQTNSRSDQNESLSSFK
ncbi:solute:Na+ symporter, SSS family [Halobacillus dabanensis]|uniref:Solute:Na+ symporter, SSS family n=1 Tax=Halobacillus dabanensis TaxID=240302 RepID=A0A1I3YHL2_HALDA|nr:sodium:solute symporter family protein [Halobacillus dabanensis]SFK31295.1 solute:Na+ symporter, SSS family [Halobacillus dabanensis]